MAVLPWLLFLLPTAVLLAAFAIFTRPDLSPFWFGKLEKYFIMVTPQW